MSQPLLKHQVTDASRWIYRGVWAVLVRWFRVPAEPPTLPAAECDRASSARAEA